MVVGVDWAVESVIVEEIVLPPVVLPLSRTIFDKTDEANPPVRRVFGASALPATSSLQYTTGTLFMGRRAKPEYV
jgi:hypothetical protein